jgi:predicted transcriptional regulator
VEKDRVSGNMMRDLLSRVFDGSASQMVLSLIETSDIDSRELADLRKLIGRKAKEQEK